MYLVVSEKPSVAQAIAKVLGAYKKEDGYFSGRDCIVSWCLGHLAEYAMPEAYDEKYRKWNLDDLPILPEQWKLEVARDKSKQFQVLKKLLNNEIVPVDYVVNACDAGREGELIFKRVYDLSGSRIPVKRLWISSMEDKAILDGFAHLKEGEAYRNLADASVCRAQADWLVGINATRAFTKTYDYRLTVGRVQTPTLALLVQRSLEIDNFRKEQFFITHLLMEDVDAVSEHFSDRSEAEQAAGICRGGTAKVQAIKKEKKTVPAPKLYDLTTLQREANRLFGFTAKQTLEYAQSLYEKKLLTYPRTDSQYLTDDMADTVAGIMNLLPDILPYRYDAPASYDINRMLDSKKVSDHHAIIPTEEIEKTDTNSLSEGERIILLMAANRLLCAAAPKYEYLSVKAEIGCCGYSFTASGKTVLNDGWKKYEDALKKNLRVKEEKKDSRTGGSLPELSEGQRFQNVQAKVTDQWTKPPSPYTEDSLLAAMERAGNDEMDDEVERKGLGTPATRAGIIEKLVLGGYAARKKKQIVATEGGAKMIALTPEYLKSPQMTADWENRLLMMERGETSAEAFMEDIYALIGRILEGCREIPKEERQRFVSEGAKMKGEIGTCPVCGKPVREGKSNFYCVNRECSFALWKENRYLSSMRKNIDRRMAAELLDKGKTHAKDFYSAKSGKNFEADLWMDVSPDGKTSFRMEFPKRASGEKKQ